MYSFSSAPQVHTTATTAQVPPKPFLYVSSTSPVTFAVGLALTLFFTLVAYRILMRTPAPILSENDFTCVKSQLHKLREECTSLRAEVANIKEELRTQRDEYIDERLDLVQGVNCMQRQRKSDVKLIEQLAAEVSLLQRHRGLDCEERESLIETVQELIERLDNGREKEGREDESKRVWEQQRAWRRRSQGTGEDSGFADFDGDFDVDGVGKGDGFGDDIAEAGASHGGELERFAELECHVAPEEDFQVHERLGSLRGHSGVNSSYRPNTTGDGREGKAERSFYFERNDNELEKLSEAIRGSGSELDSTAGPSSIGSPSSEPVIALHHNAAHPSLHEENVLSQTELQGDSLRNFMSSADFHARLQQGKIRLLTNLWSVKGSASVPGTPTSEKGSLASGWNTDGKVSRSKSMRQAVSKAMRLGSGK